MTWTEVTRDDDGWNEGKEGNIFGWLWSWFLEPGWLTGENDNWTEVDRSDGTWTEV